MEAPQVDLFLLYAYMQVKLYQDRLCDSEVSISPAVTCLLATLLFVQLCFYTLVPFYLHASNYHFQRKRSARIKRALSSFASSEEDQERIGNEVSDRVIQLKQEMDKELTEKVLEP